MARTPIVPESVYRLDIIPNYCDRVAAGPGAGCTIIWGIPVWSLTEKNDFGGYKQIATVTPGTIFLCLDTKAQTEMWGLTRGQYTILVGDVKGMIDKRAFRGDARGYIDSLFF